jgi:hypothetical protein
MGTASDMWPPLNYDRCRSRLRAIPAGSTKVLANWAFTSASLAYLRPLATSEAEWPANLPSSPFDFEFFLAIVRGYFEQTDWLSAVLNGADPQLPIPAPVTARRLSTSRFTIEERENPLNEDAAADAIETLANPIARHLLGGALQWARLHFRRQPALSDADFESRLPAAPFDFNFYARVLTTMFRIVGARDDAPPVEGEATASESLAAAIALGARLFGEAVQGLRSLPSAQRTEAFEGFAREITRATGGTWSATRLPSADGGSMFVGEGAGRALVFDSRGNMYSGSIARRVAFPLSGDIRRPYLPDYSRLRPK